jgi:hypothetical protein
MHWRPFIFRVQEFLARNRIVITATLGVFVAPMFAQGLRTYLDPKESVWPWAVAFFALYLLQFFAAISPPHYAKAELLQSVLPTIHAVMGLQPTDRVTIHHLKSKRRQLYEQITDYEPNRHGKGRVFPFSHGIVGQCFKTVTWHTYRIPPGITFDAAMKERWSFSVDEFARLPKDRRSFATYPLGSDGKFARAVLYMDSDRPDTFDDATELEKKIATLFRRQLELIIE